MARSSMQTLRGVSRASFVVLGDTCGVRALSACVGTGLLLIASAPDGGSLLEAGAGWVECRAHSFNWASGKNRKRCVTSVAIASRESHLQGGLFESALVCKT